MKTSLLKQVLVAALVAFGATSANAIEWDCTNLVKTTPAGWTGSTGWCATQFAPAAEVSGESSPVRLVENYQGSNAGASTTGKIIYQTVTGLENGNYKIAFWANAFSTADRDAAVEFGMNDGDDRCAYVFANEKQVAVISNRATSTTENGHYEFELEVTDGTIEIGLGRNMAGPNWLSVQIHYLIRYADEQEIIATETAPLRNLLAEAKAIENPSDFLKGAIEEAETVLELIDGYELEEIRDVITDAVAALQGAINFEKGELIVNGTFDNGTDPWQSDTGAQNQGTATNQQGAFDGPFWENWNPSVFSGRMYQELNGLPTGTYELQICAFVNNFEEGTGAQYVFANEDKTYLTTGSPTAYKCYTYVTDGTLTVGLEQSEPIANWMGIDNVVVTYIGEADQAAALNEQAQQEANEAGQAAEEEAKQKRLEELNEAVSALIAQAQELLENSDAAPVKDELQNAISEGQSASDIESLEFAQQTLQDAIASANNIINANLAIANANALIGNTNFYTPEALERYKECIADAEDYLAHGQVPDFATLGVTVGGWHSDNDVDNLLMSCWDGGFDGDWATYYINTWSVEGNNDDSNFLVPFFEYWVSDVNTLAERDLTGTMTGLDPDQTYYVGAIVRVRRTNNSEEAPFGITLKVGDGPEEDVTDGEQVTNNDGTMAPLFLKEVKASGKTDSSGTLTVKFIVSEENNISWLAFKNVKYSTDPTAVGIENMTPDMNKQAKNSAIFNALGQRVMNAVKSGLYIVNGKKYMVK